jgi:hypothetical protein
MQKQYSYDDIQTHYFIEISESLKPDLIKCELVDNIDVVDDITGKIFVKFKFLVDAQIFIDNLNEFIENSKMIDQVIDEHLKKYPNERK